MIISIASGKGGTGKTLVATSLALSLESQGVQLLDCDVEEPNCHLLLKPAITGSEGACVPVPAVDEARCTFCGRCSEVCAYHAIAVLLNKVVVFSELCHGCGACAYLCPEKAISEERREVGVVEVGHCGGIEFVQGRLNVGEAMATPVIRAVKVHAGKEGTVILDVAPGTACPVVEAIKGNDFCLLVTEPTPFGLNDLALAVETARKLKVPCGVVINRDVPGYGDTEAYCHREHLPILMKIPLDRRIAVLYSRGITLAQGMPEWRGRFQELWDGIRSLVGVKA